jgi:hypothetical protein
MDIQRPSQGGRKRLIRFAYAGGGLLAILVARRATRVDPMITLRY